MVKPILFWAAFLVVALLVASLVIWPLRRQRLLTLSLALLLPSALLGLYWHWGAWSALEHTWQLQANRALVQNFMAENPSSRQVSAMLQRFVAKHPKEAKAWYYLGKLAMRRNAYQEARTQFKTAAKLVPDNLLYQTAYAEAAFFAEGKQLSAQTQGVLQTVLQQDSHNVAAINLLAIDAFNRGDYKKAVHHWQQLLAEFPPSSQDAKMIYAMIAQADKKLETRKENP